MRKIPYIPCVRRNSFGYHRMREVIRVTVGIKMQQTIASAEGVASNLKQFALDTQDQQAKQMFNQLAQTVDNCVTTLQSRLTYIQQQEPQYRQQ